MDKKIWLFIDYANLLSSTKRIGSTFDFKKLCNFLSKEFGWKLEFQSIYFAYPKESTRDYDVSWMHRFSHFLARELWFHVKKKPLKQIEQRDLSWNILYGEDGIPLIKEKWNLDIEITMDVMQTWHHFDIMVLFSWDSDFSCLTDFLLWKWKKVYIFSTTWNISTELRNRSTKYYDIAELPKELFLMKNPNK